MDVLLRIHLERADGEVVWWAETDAVPGFSAAADSLVEMRAQALNALEEIAQEQGQSLGQVREQLVPTAVAETANPSPSESQLHRTPTYATA